MRRRSGIGIDRVGDGDVLLVSGPVGDHGIAVLLAREDFDLQGRPRSDCASVGELCRALWPLPGLRFMRDPTRGGLVTVAHEIALASGLAVCLNESDVPIRESTRAVCEILGYDPLYLACEGRVVAALAAEQADEALSLWRAMPEGREAARIGVVEPGRMPVVLQTALGGQRVLEELAHDPLPRIC